MKIKAWTALKKGDTIDVVAPGFAPRPEEVEGAFRYLREQGYVPRAPKDLIENHFLHANNDSKRFLHLKQALLARDSAAVWCLRGGYGSNRLLPALSKVKKPSLVKPLIGISDISSLHVFLSQKWGWPTLHGSLLDRLGQGKVPDFVERELWDVLEARQSKIRFENLIPMNTAAQKKRRIKASVVGGNLVTLQSTIGTPWQLKTAGHFLFIEDLGERGYRVDRILEHFRQAGLFKSCRGLLIGEFLGGAEPQGPALWPEVFERWAADLKIPVLRGLPAGHGDVQRVVPLSTVARLELGASPCLEIDSGVK